MMRMRRRTDGGETREVEVELGRVDTERSEVDRW